MNVLLTSCGLETDKITETFLNMLSKEPEEIKAMFVPTAAITPDSVEVLPACLQDLLKIDVKRENITVYDLYDNLEDNLYEKYDVIYLCGGSPKYLLRRVNECSFRQKLLEFIDHSGVILGVSAGSMIFAGNMPDNLGLLPSPLKVHCSKDSCEKPGKYTMNQLDEIKLGNEQAIVFEGDGYIIIE